MFDTVKFIYVSKHFGMVKIKKKKIVHLLLRYRESLKCVAILIAFLEGIREFNISGQ